MMGAYRVWRRENLEGFGEGKRCKKKHQGFGGKKVVDSGVIKQHQGKHISLSDLMKQRGSNLECTNKKGSRAQI
jgi:hypothetical protein